MIDIEDLGLVRRLTLNNPGHRNAISTAGWSELTEALRDFDASPLRSLIITGAGDDFCSGADLSDDLFAGASVTAGHESMAIVGAAAAALHRIGKPTIAAVSGVAVGAGMNLAIGCDIVIASETARFSEIFVKRGLTLDFGGSWLLPRVVGLARARELALTGRVVAAPEAERIGLATRVVPAGRLQSEALDLAATLGAGAPLAQRSIKVALDRSLEWSFEQALAYEDRTQATLLSSRDVGEGVTAFLEKRPPDFEGR